MTSPIGLYRKVASAEERLILDHMSMVKRVAVHLRSRIPPVMDVEELVQVGMVGLIEAARGFDASRGTEFEHFAVSRVRGAMLDEVRRLSSRSRSAIAFQQTAGNASQVLTADLGREPTSAELAGQLGLGIDQFHRERDAAHRFEVQPIDLVSEEALSIADDVSRQPDEIVERAQSMEALARSIDQLGEREQLMMQLYYVEELTLKEIGEVLGVTESRVSQILSATARKLRQNLGMN